MESKTSDKRDEEIIVVILFFMFIKVRFSTIDNEIVEMKLNNKKKSTMKSE